ncbi:geranylgeranylglycerol-phosphate geranylgeranyltransferase [Pseudotenacibaculum sp. MALMAid0570]|uniref:geranylgeranylglycerol-phosphate geranylgeranyltransferase n=1 Tax=Pseudotenacibaculum sp. MALMAid0570 TaxID=3143938 RepID=UPI0032E00AA1
MISFLKLIRYKNLLMVLLSMILTKYALIDYFLPESYLSNLEFSLLSLSVLLITAGGYIINDIFDIEADEINKPSKVFIGRTISKRKAWLSYVFSTVIGLSIGIFLSFQKYVFDHSFFFIGVTLALFLYSKFLKKIALIGNLLIAFLCSLVIYLTYSFDFRVNSDNFLNQYNYTDLSIEEFFAFSKISIRFFIQFSFIMTFLREIIKDIEDIDGDYNKNYKTLPIVFGKIRTRNSIIILSIIAFLYLSLFVYIFYEAFGLYPLTIATIIIQIAFLYFIYKLWNSITKKQFHELSNLIKLIMLAGILSMGLFKFI